MMDDVGDLNWLFSQDGFTRKDRSTVYGRKRRGILVTKVNARLDGYHA